MRIVLHLAAADARIVAPVATLGNFDGVHRGHQEILTRVVRQARERGTEPVVMTFFPHPAAVLAPAKPRVPLGSLRERLAHFRDAGIGTVVVQRFTRSFAAFGADEFIERYLVERLRVQKIVIGHSVSFGCGRSGNAHSLVAAGRRLGFEVEVVGPVAVDGLAVSSTEVRNRLIAGDVAVGNRLLGRTYSVDGRVIRGEQRGRTLGFPTANLRPPVSPIVPNGVYAVHVDHGHRRYGGVANVGTNPTFGPGRERTLEAHVFDFSKDVYGQRLRVSFVERLRGEMKFASVGDLALQIRRDAEAAREALAL